MKNGELFQWWSGSSARTGIMINCGSVTIEEDVRVMGGVPDRDVLCPSITLNGGSLILKEGAALLSGLQVPEGKVLADYLPEGTAFVKCSYDYDSNTVTVSDPQEFVSNAYTANESTESMVIVSHTHDFSGSACPCGFNCDHSTVDTAAGKCETCGKQLEAAIKSKDGAVIGFDSFISALDSVQSNMTEEVTVVLLQNYELNSQYILDRSNNIKLDLNTNSISGSGGFVVNADSKLTLANGSLGENIIVEAAGGKCEDVCRRQIYTAVLTKADGTSANYEAFTDAWTAAIDNEGSTLKLLCDITLNNAEDGIIVQSGKFTFDLNGKTVSGEITNQLLTVSGTADITVKNGKLINTFSVDRTDINNAYANALEIDGGTVTLDGVELTAGHGFEGARSCAAYIFSGSLTVVNGTFTGPFGVADVFGVHPSVKITSATLYDGIFYDRTGITAIDYIGLKALFADGSMLFDKDGKYIDAEDEAYWQIEGEGEDVYVAFVYGEECVIKPHTHTYADGKCAECDYACPHDSGKNDREAGYFEKAICSVCHAEYGDFAPDTTAPTGEIKIKERSWWQSLLNTISFGIFYKEEITVSITADDDSYTQPGYDETKHAVKIEYLISDTVLSEEAVKTSSEFREYTVPIGLSTERQYVVYVRLTDYTDNVAYAGSEEFEIDKTAPVIENMVDGGHYTFCLETRVKLSDKNIDKIALDGREESLNSDGELCLRALNNKEQTLGVTDKAGNTLTVYITIYAKHEIDEETLTCRHCDVAAVAKVTADDFVGYYATLTEALNAGLSDQRENVVVISHTILVLEHNKTITQSEGSFQSPLFCCLQVWK